MELRQYVKAIRKFWWVALIPALIGGLLGVFMVSRHDPQYRSSMTFFVRTIGDTSANGQFAGDQFAQRRVNSYVALLSTDRLAQAVIDGAHVELTPGEVTRMIDASGDVNTVLLTASVTTGSKELSTKLGEQLAVQFVRMVDQVEETTGKPSGVSIELVSGPSVDVVPTRPMLTVGLLGLVGLAIGVAAAIALELRDISIRSDEEIDELHGGPVLSHIVVDRSLRTSPLVVSDGSRHALHEGFRRLRTNLQFLDVENPAKVLVITSSVAEEGKSTTTANLGLVLAAAGRRVLLVEADLHRPKLAESFQIERAVGLTDILIGRAKVGDVVQSWSDNLDVLPCGHLPPNPSELIGGESAAGLIEGLREHYDHILIDTPPMLPLTDAAVIAAHADGTVLVVRYAKTTRTQLTRSLRALDAVGARILGTVVTMVPPGDTDGYATYDYAPSRSIEDRSAASAAAPTWSKVPSTRNGTSSDRPQGKPLPPAPDVAASVGSAPVRQRSARGSGRPQH